MLSWYKPVVAAIRWSSGLQTGRCMSANQLKTQLVPHRMCKGSVPGTSRVSNVWDMHTGLVMVQAIGLFRLILLCCVPNWVSRH